MDLTFSVEEVPATRVLSARTVVSEAELGGAIARLFGGLYAVVGAKAEGPPVCIYPEPYDPARVVVDAGVPYGGEPPYGYDVNELPAGRAVVGRLVGPYEQLAEAWRTAMAYVGDQGLVVSSAPYERYRVGMGQAEPAAFETDIIIPV